MYSEKTSDDGQRSCPKHVDFYSKNKFEKLVHLVCFYYKKFNKMHGHMNFKKRKLKKFACLSLDIKTGSKLPQTTAFVSLLFHSNSYNPFTRNCSYKNHLNSQNHVLRFLPEEILPCIMKTRLYFKKNKSGL